MKKCLNVGVIGVGWIGKIHSEAFRRVPLTFDLAGAKINLLLAADVDRASAESAAEKYGFRKWTTDWHKVVQDREIDIVDVCVPNTLHKEIVIEAAKNGKHILCEKPLSTSPENSKQMIQEVERAKVKHLVNFNYRKVPGITYAKSLIDEGEIGKPLLFRALISQDFAFKNEASKGWRFEPSQSGGGSLVTLGSHAIDMARYLFGNFASVIAATFEMPRRKKSAVNVEDETILLLRFENKAIGSITSSWIAHGRKHHFEFEINTEKASIFFNSERLNELQVVFGSDEERRQGFRTIYIGQPHPYGDCFQLKTGMGIGIKETFVIQFYEFIRSIIQDQEASPNFLDGWFVDQVIEKAYLSSRSEQWEDIQNYLPISG